MKILYVATYEGLSGASYSLLGLMSAVRDAGHEVHCIVLKKGKIISLLEDKHIPYTIVRGFPWVSPFRSSPKCSNRLLIPLKTFLNWSADRKICRLIRQEQFDIVHINASTAGVGARAAKHEGVPFVWHLREFVEEDLEKEFWNKKASMKLIGSSDAVIAISESVREKFVKSLPNAPYHVIYNGIEQKPFLAGRDKPIFSEAVAVITIAGRIDPTKGQRDLLDAAIALRKQGVPNFKIQIVGKSQDPAFEESLKQYVTVQKLNDVISFLGFRNDLPDILLHTDISVVSSRMEAFGRVTAEAMLAGNLVIGADTGGTKELLRDEFGLLYRQGNVADLAEKMQYALSHQEEMSERASHAREYALSTFTSARNATEIIKVYEKVRNGVDVHA